MISIRSLIAVGATAFLLGVFLKPVIFPKPPIVRVFTPEEERNVARHFYDRTQEEERKDSDSDDSNDSVEPKKLEPSPDASHHEFIQDLRYRNLAVPVAGASIEDVRNSFHEARGDRVHEAVDILAARNTPVVAVEDGKIVKLFYSVRGGTTIYQFDETETYAYYYAHLERYAEDVEEGESVKKGEVIGYVGTSGNAPPNTPHLHFAIFKLNEDKRWWEGTAIDPYEIFKR